MQMRVNWFEGGRRITKLCIAISALVGAYNSYFEFNPPILEFSTASPRDSWAPSLVPSDATEWAKTPLVCAHSEDLRNFEIKPGLVRNVSLCFLSNDEGKIIYYSGQEEANRLKKLEDAVSRAKASDEPEKARLLSEEAARVRTKLSKEGLYELSGSPYHPEVKGYIDQRAAEFEITSPMLPAIDKHLRLVEKEALLMHIKEMLAISAYFIGGFWLFSLVIGWIVRGFAGIPRGQDFRPAQESDVAG